MSQSTLLISQQLLLKLKESGDYSNSDLRKLLNIFLKDPDLWKKLSGLKSTKHTKTYQSEGLNLVALRFFPDPEDWSKLSILSHGTGFSRCYIFVYLLEFYLKIRELKKVTIKQFPRITDPHTIRCRVKINKKRHYLQRYLKPSQKRTKISPLVNTIHLRPDRILRNF